MQINIQEFEANVAKYVEQIQLGNVIELTSYRKVVARIVGVPQIGSEGINRLAVEGVATWLGGKPTGASFVLPSNLTSLSDMVIEDRGG